MTIDDYRKLPYTRRVERLTEDGEVYFVAYVAEIPWIRIDGGSPEEALLKLSETFDDCVQTMLDAGDHVPTPVQWPDNFGRPPRPEAGGEAMASRTSQSPESGDTPWSTLGHEHRQLEVVA